MQVVRFGDKNDSVLYLQEILNALGYDVGNPNGTYGQKTSDAVFDFQKKYQLKLDGVVGNNTWTKLKEVYPVVILYTDLPLPKSNKSKAAAQELISKVANITSMDVKLLNTFISIESNFDYLVKASTTSATGWFQFLDATWKTMIRRYGIKYGILEDISFELRKDPRVNALMGAELLNENIQALTKSTKRKPTDTDLYMAHFLGISKASKFLTSPLNAIAAQLFTSEAAANPSIFYKDPKGLKDKTTDGQPRTIKEVYMLMDSKVNKYRD